MSEPAADETYPEIRAAVRAVCARFPGVYSGVAVVDEEANPADEMRRLKKLGVRGSDTVEVVDPAEFEPGGVGLERFDFAARAEVADAVFVGDVERIEYRRSRPDSRGGTLPFTFVTWRAERAWKGVVAGELVTARFVGGVSPEGYASVVSEVPLFQEGDRDVIFLDQNGLAGCPLLGCAAGRLRLIDGRVYDDEGGSIVANDAGEVVVGGWRNLPEVNVVTVGSVLVDRRIDQEGPGEGADGMAERAFTGLLDARLVNLVPAPATRSVSPDAPFVVRFLDRELSR